MRTRILIVGALMAGLTMSACSKNDGNSTAQPTPVQQPVNPFQYNFNANCNQMPTVPSQFGSPDIQGNRIINRQLKLAGGFFEAETSDSCLNEDDRDTDFSKGYLSSTNGNIVLNFDGQGQLAVFMFSQYGNFCPQGAVSYQLNDADQTIEIAPFGLKGSPSSQYVALETSRGRRWDRNNFGMWAADASYSGTMDSNWASLSGGFSGNFGSNGRFRTDYQPGQPQGNYPNGSFTTVNQGNPDAGVIEAAFNEGLLGRIQVAYSTPQHILQAVFRNQPVETASTVRAGNTSCQGRGLTRMSFLVR